MEDRIEPPGHLRLIVVKRLERNISEQNLGYEQNIRFDPEISLIGIYPEETKV